MELEAGSGKAARRTGRLNNDRGPARMLTAMPNANPVNWQQISQMKPIAGLIDDDVPSHYACLYSEIRIYVDKI